jgi:hypothetical protein
MTWSTTGWIDETFIGPDWLTPIRTAVDGSQVEELTRFVPPAHAGRHAAVLVLFGEDVHGPDILLIKRAADLRADLPNLAWLERERELDRAPTPSFATSWRIPVTAFGCGRYRSREPHVGRSGPVSELILNPLSKPLRWWPHRSKQMRFGDSPTNSPAGFWVLPVRLASAGIEADSVAR